MMILRILKKYKLIFFSGFVLFSMNCRQPVIPTEEDLADYGWTLYETGKYQEAREWFYDAVAKDSSYADGYNGIGWCFGKLRRADSAAVYFHISQTKPFDSYDTPDLDLDLYAGLTFAYSGMHIDSLVREYAIQKSRELESLLISASKEAVECLKKNMAIRCEKRPKEIDSFSLTFIC